MPTVRHWIIAHACTDDPGLLAELPALALPALQRWLTLAPVVAEASHGPHTLNAPHEQALARALGWPERADPYPWAGWQAQRPGTPCAWLVPCHWQASLDHMVVLPPAALQLSVDEAQALRQAWAPYAASEGLDLLGGEATRWLASGTLLAHWPVPSLARVAHRRLDTWWDAHSDDPAARRLLRVLEEAQMLWHDHPVNDARRARGLPPINALWVEGAGVWDGLGPSPVEAPAQVWHDLTPAALAGDAASWRDTWQRLDREHLGPWLQAALDDGQPRWLTLCGERGWRCWRLDPGTAAPPPRRRWWPWPRRAPETPFTPSWWVGL